MGNSFGFLEILPNLEFHTGYPNVYTTPLTSAVKDTPKHQTSSLTLASSQSSQGIQVNPHNNITCWAFTCSSCSRAWAGQEL